MVNQYCIKRFDDGWWSLKWNHHQLVLFHRWCHLRAAPWGSLDPVQFGRRTYLWRSAMTSTSGKSKCQQLTNKCVEGKATARATLCWSWSILVDLSCFTHNIAQLLRLHTITTTSICSFQQLPCGSAQRPLQVAGDLPCLASQFPELVEGLHPKSAARSWG